MRSRRYATLIERLRRAGFSPDVNEEGNPPRQRWKIEDTAKVTVDFLIQPTLPGGRGGRLPPPLDDPSAVKAAGILEQEFSDHDEVGPRRVAGFLTGEPDDAIQADAVGFFEELRALLREG